ncbi:MAG: prepilin-type N-terminal cleavage/methylation domain-containing protein [Rhodobacteraceae bacterium]|nr:prepilin-type N-terminal cleavage/methylation domain-containing protein [Paracoccaceae bacterium]
MSRKTRHDQGMTLIELIIVLAVFALIATLSLQALSGTLRSRDRLVALEENTADITLALSLLRADLQAAVPLVFHTPGGLDHSALEIAPGGQRLALSLSGQMDLPGVSLAGLGRAIWRFDPARGQLTRASWPVLIPATQAALSPEVVLARGIIGFEIRTMTPEFRWITGPDPNLGGTGSALPRAVEVTLTSVEFGRISTLVSYP